MTSAALAVAAGWSSLEANSTRARLDVRTAEARREAPHSEDQALAGLAATQSRIPAAHSRDRVAEVRRPGAAAEDSEALALRRVKTARSETLPPVEQETGGRVSIGGTTASNLDFS
jgi:hypothetical protein